MKPSGVLTLLFVALFVAFLGYSLAKSDKPVTAAEVKTQLQLDDDKQEHEITLKQFDLQRDLELNRQQLDYQAYLQQQTLNHDAQLAQLKMQKELANEQWKSNSEVQIAQQKQQAQTTLKQLELDAQSTLNQQKLAAESTHLGITLQHEEAMQRQTAETTERHIYVLSGAGVGIILVLSAASAVFFHIWRRSRLEMTELHQQHHYQIEERKLTHEVRMKVLDVIVKFPPEERADIIMQVISPTAAPAHEQSVTVLDMPLEEPDTDAKPRETASVKTLSYSSLPTLALMPIHDSKPLVAQHISKIMKGKSSLTQRV